MYDYIKGKFVNKSETSRGKFLTVEVGGVGYLVEITGRDFGSADAGGDGKIYTVLLHREDKMALCGFLHREDRDIFNILVLVSGVGSKMALTLLDEFTPSELIGFVIDGNFKELTRAKGVGPKLAQKIILELKDKLMSYQTAAPVLTGAAGAPQNSQALDDAQTVLVSFGYGRDEIKTALAKAVVKESASAEEILKEALKILSC